MRNTVLDAWLLKSRLQLKLCSGLPCTRCVLCIFYPLVLASLYSCSCLLPDNISCYFLVDLSMFFDSCTDRFAGSGRREISGDDSKMSSFTVMLLAHYTFRFISFCSYRKLCSSIFYQHLCSRVAIFACSGFVGQWLVVMINWTVYTFKLPFCF